MIVCWSTVFQRHTHGHLNQQMEVSYQRDEHDAPTGNVRLPRVVRACVAASIATLRVERSRRAWASSQRSSVAETVSEV
jgi:hypothetical protein